MENQELVLAEKKQVKAYISEIVFNNGKRLAIEPDDIVLLVGPNNVGKSQSLNDIYSRAGDNNSTIVISGIHITKSEGSLIPLIKKASKTAEIGSQISFSINGYGYGFDKNGGDEVFKNHSNYAGYRDLFIAWLTTEARLGICNPAGVVDRNQTWSNPIHNAAFDTECGKWLSESFCKAFGNHLTANSLHGQSIPLCIGPKVKLDDKYEDEQERINVYAGILEKYRTVNTQGDGIKSFTGILLYLMLKHYTTYLIDEPESFLHPPQARIMGQIIGETLREDQQAFISTHSDEIVKGLLDVCEDRLKIIRITRVGDINSFSILDNMMIKKVFGDPLLKYSNIMSSLFHKTVVLCESDSDCKLYSLIENYLMQQNGKYSETLFIHCGGKHRMARTAEAMLSLNIDVRLVPDIDVLNDEVIVKGIAETFGVDWGSLKSDYNKLVSGLHSHKEKINRINAKDDIMRVLDGSRNRDLSNNEIKEIQKIVKIVSKWDGIKHGGKQMIPNGEPSSGYNNIEAEFKKHHIYLVPVGELEGFIKDVDGHGPEWVNNVLEKYPNIGNDVYNTIREFVKEIIL